MTDTSLLVVGGRIQTVRKATELGIPVVSIQHRNQLIPGAAEFAEVVLVVDFTDWDAVWPLTRALHDRYHFGRAVSLTEAGLEPASRINEALGLGGTPYRTTKLLQDKGAMRKHLATVPAAAGAVAARPLTDNAGLRDFADRYGFPIVVKPATGTASLGVIRVDRPEQIPSVLPQVTALRQGSHPYSQFFRLIEFVVEEYVDGTEYSVETFSFGGRHSIIAITEKVSLPNFVELGHALPARLDPTTETTVVECTRSFLDAVGVVDGAGHTEIKLSSTGPRVIESHNRIGGDRIVDLVETAYGIDLELYTVAWPFGLIEELPPRPAPRCAAATRFLVAEPGTVTDIKGVEEVRAAAGVLDLEITVSTGTEVHELTSNWARVGQVLVTAVDTAAAVHAAEQLADTVTIVTR